MMTALRGRIPTVHADMTEEEVIAVIRVARVKIAAFRVHGRRSGEYARLIAEAKAELQADDARYARRYGDGAVGYQGHAAGCTCLRCRKRSVRPRTRDYVRHLTQITERAE